jgi:Xaa-Pro aminopeptidase
MTAPTHPPEISAKLGRIAAFLDRHNLDGVLLWQRPNFAWITGGGDNHIPSNSAIGVAAIYATRDRLTCLTNVIEAPRISAEELPGTGIETVAYPWHDRPAIVAKSREILTGKVAADWDETGLGLLPLPSDFAELRWALCPEEIARYREGGKRTSNAMERAARRVRSGMTEHEAAGILDHEMHAAGLTPVVTVVASDERIERFRHPIPRAKKIDRIIMLVTCAAYHGLISNLTRFVHFGPIPADRAKRLEATARIDATVNLATRPERTLGEMFIEIQRAYADAGYADQWKLLHQGGSTGYCGREAFATPGSNVKVLENQAFAWNPTLPGTKSEDTMLCTSSGIEFLTRPSPQWPAIEVTVGGKTLRRAGALVV